MNQQVTVEDALTVFRKRCSDLTDANALLEARTIGLERQIQELETEKSQLMKSLEDAGVAVAPQAEPQPPITSGY